jgi:Sec-independent protein secretion pathway component TatC
VKSLKKEKDFFVIVLIGWIIIVLTFFHDIILALKYDMKVPQAKLASYTVGIGSKHIDLRLFDRLFPFCCLSHHQPTEWVLLWERLKFLAGISFGWFIITTLWILVKKGILTHEKDDL